jgi:predicted nucleotidyltransferase
MVYNTDMLEFDQKKIDEVAKAHDLKLMLLFGSHAKGTAKSDSDLDVAVLGNNPIGTDQIIDLNNDLAEVFQVKEIDVKSLHNTNPLFRFQVTKDSKLLYGRRRDYLAFRAYAFRDYIDSQSLLRLKEKLIQKRLNKLNN